MIGAVVVGVKVVRTEKVMSEKEITNQILRYLKTVPDCFCWKQHGSQYSTAGLPDVICCLQGRFVAFEVKTPTGKLTKLQDTMLHRIQRAKGYAFKVTSVNEVREIVKSLLLIGGQAHGE